MNFLFELLTCVDDDFLTELRDDWDQYEEDGSAKNTALRKQAIAMKNHSGSPSDELSYWMKEVAFEAYRVGLKRLTGEWPGPD